MVKGKIKTIFGMILITKSFQLRFQRLWQPSSGSAKIQSKYHLLTTRN